jgi:hypothetical protein
MMGVLGPRRGREWGGGRIMWPNQTVESKGRQNAQKNISNAKIIDFLPAAHFKLLSHLKGEFNKGL